MVTPRLREEIEFLRVDCPDAEVDENGGWVHIPSHQLVPSRFNKPNTRLVVVLPPGYPNTGPDNFFVDGDLRLADGSTPPGFNQGNHSSSGPCPLPGAWSWFSWHPESWRPHAEVARGDNLRTLMRAINACLRGEERT
jgi:hypothetical protein